MQVNRFAGSVQQGDTFSKWGLPQPTRPALGLTEYGTTRPDVTGAQIRAAALVVACHVPDPRKARRVLEALALVDPGATTLNKGRDA